MAICPLRIRGICSVAAICMSQKQKSELFCNFFAIRDSLLSLQSVNRPFRGRFAAFSGRNTCFGTPRQSLIEKKLQFGPYFCFWVPGRLCWSNYPEAYLLAFRMGVSDERRKQKRLAKSKPLSCEVVPEAGFEPARLSTTVFETAASAVPPLGRRTALYLKPENSSSETNYS